MSHINEEEMKDDEEEDYMIPKQQIINLNHIMNNKKEQIDNIYKKTLLVSQ